MKARPEKSASGFFVSICFTPLAIEHETQVQCALRFPLDARYARLYRGLLRPKRHALIGLISGVIPQASDPQTPKKEGGAEPGSGAWFGPPGSCFGCKNSRPRRSDAIRGFFCGVQSHGGGRRYKTANQGLNPTFEKRERYPPVLCVKHSKSENTKEQAQSNRENNPKTCFG
jgi:hypothetical protein